MEPTDMVGQEDVLPSDCRFDARLVSLYSRGIQSGMLRGLIGGNLSYSFCYYDAIEVQPVTLGEGPLLKDAYTQSQQRSIQSAPLNGKKFEDTGFSQTLVAVADLQTSSNPDGYSRKKISDFWNPKNENALFFVSMVNLVDAENLDDVLTEIKDTFQNINHLVYTSFDHCDIIIFGRGDTFQEYTDCIYGLCYAGNVGLEDTITLYSFSSRDALPKSTERFGALVRLGVRDYPSRELFYKKLSDPQGATPFTPYWLLERNDIAFYMEDVTLERLAEVRQAIMDVETEQGIQWYTTYDLIVLLKDHTNNGAGKWKKYESSAVNTDMLQEHMSKLYDSFRNLYENVYRVLQEKEIMINSDQVWLRWLEDSYRLVVSLLSSRLSVDLGICLVSQFIDLLKYGNRLFDRPAKFTQEHTEEIQKTFSEFFSNIAILVDSMNQTNRQFIQVPSFHLPSFQVPPQIMAYYTVILRKIVQVLNDTESVFYGFTIAPKLVDTLSVFSLSRLDILPDDEWLSINMDESSFYTLRLTTETLAHEVSHFVGDKRRNRALRKECILKCELQLLLEELLSRLNKEILRITKPLNSQLPTGLPVIYFDTLAAAAQVIWDMAQRVRPEYYGPESNTFSRDVENAIWQLTEDINTIPPLNNTTFEQVWELINLNAGENGLLKRLEFYCKWKYSQEDTLPGGSMNESFNAVVRQEAKGIITDIIEDINAQILPYRYGLIPEAEVLIGRQLGYLCYMFRETFADLQAIILLNMEWADYCRLLLQVNKFLGKDHPPRMTAVAKALIDSGIWKNSDITGGGEKFSSVRKAILLDPAKNSGELEELRISSSLTKYLLEYLVTCAKDITNYLNDEKRCSRVQELQAVHKALSENNTFLDLQKIILKLTGEYQKELLLKCKDGDEAK